MSENWKIQISPKLTDGTLVNLRAETPDEAVRVLDWAIENAAKIGEAVKAVNAVSVVASVVGGQVVSHETTAQQQAPQQNWSQQGSQQAQAPAAPQGGGKQCIHGDMVHRSGNKNGRAWSGYFCPTPKGTPNQCAPVFG